MAARRPWAEVYLIPLTIIHCIMFFTGIIGNVLGKKRKLYRNKSRNLTSRKLNNLIALNGWLYFFYFNVHKFLEFFHNLRKQDTETKLFHLILSVILVQTKFSLRKVSTTFCGPFFQPHLFKVFPSLYFLLLALHAILYSPFSSIYPFTMS